MRNKRDFGTSNFTNAADIADDGTFTVNYPPGFNDGDFENAVGHYAMLNGDKLQVPTDITLSFGTTTVTVTNRTGSALIAGSGIMHFNTLGQNISRRGPKVNAAGTTNENVTSVQSLAVKELVPMVVDFGAPITLDANGLWNQVAAGATASTGNTTTMVTATADPVSLGLGVLDVPRACSMAGSSGSNHIVTLNGLDVYGQPMSESFTLNGTNTISGVKAFSAVTDYAVAAGASGDTFDVGWLDVFGLPVALRSQFDVLSESQAGTRSKVLSEIEQLHWSILEAEADAGTSVWIPTGFAGDVLSMTIATGDAVTTGGNVTVEIANTAVTGLTVVVANSAAAGDIDTDTATVDGANVTFTALQALEIIFASEFNASGRFRGVVECRRTSILSNGTLVVALSNSTEPSLTTADPRGTYAPTTAADGSISFSMELLVRDPFDVGNEQFAA